VNPGTLSGTVKLFKQFGRADQAEAMIARYVEARSGEPGLFDLNSNPFGITADDPGVRSAFEVKEAEPRESANFVALLNSSKENWSADVVEALAAASVDDYFRAFKSSVGEAHRRLIYNGLQFANVGNATPAMRQVTEKARAALLAIAAESPFNTYRVARFGVAAAPEAAADAAAEGEG